MDLLLEVGCEELPARFIPPALTALEKSFEKRLADERLGGADVDVRTLGTPRRLVLLASNLKTRQEDLDEQVLGPRVEVAFDQEGKPSKACLGFAKSKGVEVADLIEIVKVEGRS